VAPGSDFGICAAGRFPAILPRAQRSGGRAGGLAALRRGRTAFTLLEVILALSLLVLVLGFLFQFYYNSMNHRQRSVASTSEAHLARVLLRQITSELRSAVGFAPGFGPGIIGQRYEITLQTTAVPPKEMFRPRLVTEDPLPGQHDIKQVRYFIAWDEDHTNDEGIPLAFGLVRQELKTLRQAVVVGSKDIESDVFEEQGQEPESQDEAAEESVRLQLYAPEIKLLEFRYYDGAQWHREWQVRQGNALPQMVRVTVGFTTCGEEDIDEMELEEIDIGFDAEQEQFPPRSYTAYVRLKQADTFFGSRMTRAASSLMEGDGL
jgi:type II secretory pathway pseudopilin PulG